MVNYVQKQVNKSAKSADDKAMGPAAVSDGMQARLVVLVLTLIVAVGMLISQRMGCRVHHDSEKKEVTSGQPSGPGTGK